MNEEKRQFIKQLCNEEGVIGALAIDQRGALKKMITKFKGSEAEDAEIVEIRIIDFTRPRIWLARSRSAHGQCRFATRL